MEKDITIEEFHGFCVKCCSEELEQYNTAIDYQTMVCLECDAEFEIAPMGWEVISIKEKKK